MRLFGRLSVEEDMEYGRDQRLPSLSIHADHQS